MGEQGKMGEGGRETSEAIISGRAVVAVCVCTSVCVCVCVIFVISYGWGLWLMLGSGQ